MKYYILTHPCAGKSWLIKRTKRANVYDHTKPNIMRRGHTDFPEGSILLGGSADLEGFFYLAVILPDTVLRRNLEARQQLGKRRGEKILYSTVGEVEPEIEKIYMTCERRRIDRYESFSDAFDRIDFMENKIKK